MRLKKLPSSRESRRYVVFRVISEEKLDYGSVRDAVWNAVLNWLGEEELARAKVRIIRNLWDSREQKGFLQVSPKFTDKVKVALGLVHQVGDSRVIIHTLRVSGTIKSAKEKTKDK